MTKAVGVHVDLVLLDVAAHGRDFGHARDGIELVADEPVLQAAEIPKREGRAFERVPEDVTNARGVRPKGRDHADGQAFATRLIRSSTRARAKYKSTLSSKTA